ncbi:MAG TPA: glycoside hydrolase family 5 protein [Clostridia bacterium]|mgnify:FL=1|nr:glycoside hydrolase family 5 protein [Clostridia bacterium]
MNIRTLCAMALAMLVLWSVTAVPAREDIVIPELSFKQKELPDLPSYDFVISLGAGWNLGNTFDATNAFHLKDEMDYEKTWVGVMTDPRVFDALKTAGFKSVRIPVSWHNHVSGENFTISKSWLARVREVVDWALDRGLFVIINTHHDNEKAYLYPDEEHLDNSLHYLRSIWTQLADAFRDYDERLIMESMNEPRLAGTDIEWWLNPEDPRSEEAVRCINQLNQAFVDTVRGKGGHNAKRYLLVPGYAASVQGCLHDAFSMPQDTPGLHNRLLLSVHAYTPYAFALQSPREAGSKNSFSADNIFDIQEIAVFMDQLYNKFQPLEIPIVIGEFGARDKDGNLQARVDFTAAYVALARARGMSCVWWDNHGFSGDGELFGLLDRRTFEFKYPEIVKALIHNAK